MVILEGNDESIDKMIWEYNQRNLSFSEFREDDLDNQLTAVTFEPTDNYDLFKKYNII